MWPRKKKRSRRRALTAVGAVGAAVLVGALLWKEFPAMRRYLRIERM